MRKSVSEKKEAALCWLPIQSERQRLRGVPDLKKFGRTLLYIKNSRQLPRDSKTSHMKCTEIEAIDWSVARYCMELEVVVTVNTYVVDGDSDDDEYRSFNARDVISHISDVFFQIYLKHPV